MALPQRCSAGSNRVYRRFIRRNHGLEEAKGGSLQDVANVIMANRVIFSLFAPNFEGYDRLSQVDKSEWEVVEFESLS